MEDYKRLFIVVIIIFVFVAVAVALTSLEKKDISKLAAQKEAPIKPNVAIEQQGEGMPGFPAIPQKEARVTNKEIGKQKESASLYEEDIEAQAPEFVEQGASSSDSSASASGKQIPAKPTQTDRIKALPKGIVLY